MSDVDQPDRIWVFDESKLNEALQAYQAEALAAYPHQSERIRMTLAAVRDFLHSKHAQKLVMNVSKRPS
jgi:hypothetical protein